MEVVMKNKLYMSLFAVAVSSCLTVSAGNPGGNGQKINGFNGELPEIFKKGNSVNAGVSSEEPMNKNFKLPEIFNNGNLNKEESNVIFKEPKDRDLNSAEISKNGNSSTDNDKSNTLDEVSIDNTSMPLMRDTFKINKLFSNSAKKHVLRITAAELNEMADKLNKIADELDESKNESDNESDNE